MGTRAPLVAPLVFVDVLIGDAQHVQTQASGAGASGTGGHMQHQIPIGVVVVRHIGRVGNRTVIYHFAQGVGDAGQLLLTALEGQRRYDPAGLLVGLRQIRHRSSCASGFCSWPVP